jgi:class 3 adenylate cyclase/CHASE3 domain sensor protein
MYYDDLSECFTPTYVVVIFRWRFPVKTFFKNLPISVKIFGLAASILILQVILSFVTHDRINQVTKKLVDITDYLVPIGDAIIEANLQTTERRIYMERILRRFEGSDPDDAFFQRELDQWKEHGLLSDRAIDRAIDLSNKGITHAQSVEDIVAFSRLQPSLEDLKAAHQQHREMAMTALQLIQKGDRGSAALLEADGEKSGMVLTGRSLKILDDLESFLGRSILSSVEHEQQALRLSWILVAVAGSIGILFASLVTLDLVRPIKTLVAQTSEVENGNLNVNIPVVSRDEMGELTGIFNKMVHGIRETQQLKATFGQYVDPRIVESLLLQTNQVDEHPMKQVMTVFFSDVAGFSHISEKLTAEGLVKLINHYLTLASEPIRSTQGVIDKFIGDAIVAFWGPPFTESTDHAQLACRAALAQATQVRKLNRTIPDLMGIRQGLPPVQIRIGLATGELLLGNMGSETSKSYTVMGNAAGFAEQLESANKIYGTQILVSELTRNLAPGFEYREIDTLFDGKNDQPVRIHELVSEEGELDLDTRKMFDVYEQGLEAYRSRQWDLAVTLFSNCQKQHDDAPARVFLDRIDILRHSPPAKDWHGIWV